MTTRIVPQSPFQCLCCPQTFTTNSNLTRHVRTIHENKNECPHCYRNHLSRWYLKNHMSTCNKRIAYELKEASKPHPRAFKKMPNYRCEICDKNFSTRTNKERHITNLHTNIMKKNVKKVCDICDKHFSTKNNKERHVKNLHTTVEKNVVKKVVKNVVENVVKNAVKKVCGTCNQKFDHLVALKSHEAKQHKAQCSQQDDDEDDDIVEIFNAKNNSVGDDDSCDGPPDEAQDGDHNGTVESSPELQQQLNQLQQQVQTEQLAKDNIQVKYDRLNIKYDKLQNLLESAKSDNSEFIDDISSFQEREELSQKEIGALKTTIEQLNDNVGLVTTKYNSLESKLKTMKRDHQERVEELKAHREDLTKEIDGHIHIYNVINNQQRKEFQLEKKLTVGREIARIARKIDNCQPCKNSLMAFLEKQKQEINNVDN